jgi:hypothetical protein
MSNGSLSPLGRPQLLLTLKRTLFSGFDCNALSILSDSALAILISNDTNF